MVEEKYRTFWPRVGAGFIDPSILLPLFIVDHLFWKEGVPSQLRAAWVTVYSLSGISYSIGMHARFGQTLGKMATKVKVLELSERKLAFRQALLRNSSSFSSGQTSIAFGG